MRMILIGNRGLPEECIGCKGDRCLHLGLKCDDIPVLDAKLQPLFEWKRKMCSKVTMEYNQGAIICRLGNNVIHVIRTWDNGCGDCPYG